MDTVNSSVNTMHKKVAFQGQTNYYGCARNGLTTRIFLFCGIERP